MRVVVVGRGPRGRVWERLVARRRDMRLAGTVDIDRQARATWPTLGDEALAAADAAIIASPPAAHAEHAQICLGAGLAVLVEKPLALSTSDARAVADAARAAGRPVLVGQNFAQRPLERAVDAALERLRPLRAGLIVSARSHGVTPAHLSGVEQPALWDFGIHHLDLIRRRAGGPPATVDATCHEQVYRAWFRWPSGLEIGWWHDDGGALFHRSEWWRGESGAVEVHGARAWRVAEGSRPRRLRMRRGSAERRLLDALALGASDVDANLGTVAMAEATARALATRQPAELTHPTVAA